MAIPTHELTVAVANYFVSATKVFIYLSILIFCGGILWCFLPKKTDAPIVRLVKTTGLISGLFITILISLIILR